MMECNRKKQLLGKSIRKIRMRRNMTQRALAKATDGISESALRSYELGERSPKQDSLERIAEDSMWYPHVSTLTASSAMTNSYTHSSS